MSSTSYEVTSEGTNGTARTSVVDTKLEVIVIPVSDIDRARDFYTKLGWRLDADYAHDEDFRVIQFTPKGSGCSIIFGKNVTAAKPGSAQGLYLIVSDVNEARSEYLRRGVAVSEIFHGAGDSHTGLDEPYLFGSLRVPGPDANRGSYRSFASFRDPDGNGWIFQEITNRLPGRVAGSTTYPSVGDLVSALRRASEAHGRHEARIGKADPNWPDWYAEYLVREQTGEELPQ